MSDDPRLIDLLLDWEEAVQQGRAVTIEDLCRDCPELRPALEQCIAKLKAITPVLDLSAYASPTRPDARKAGGGAADPEATQPEGAGRRQPIVPSGLKSWTLPGYTILGELGRGGMGVVYKARQTGLDRLVAIKMVLAGRHAGPHERARFEAEARLIAKLRHPNIVQIYDVGTYEGIPFCVLEYLEGGSLSDAVAQQRLAPVQAAELVATVADAIEHAHQQGIIHRDLKPGNVLLSSVRRSPEGVLELGVPKVADFGLARHLQAATRLTRAGIVLGTPTYMAPEQATRQDAIIGPASDVYSLGVLLYQLLAGRPPFEAPTDWQILEMVVQDEPPPLRDRCSHCPPALEAICLRCLRKDPAQRYSSAAALAADLRRYLAGDVLPDTLVPSPRRWSRRKWLLGAGGAALAAGVVAVAHYFVSPPPGPPIKVGLLNLLAGPLALTGHAVLESEQLAIQEINERGGLLGRRVEAVTPENPVTEGTLGREAERLIVEEGVCVLIGGWPSAGRRQVKEVVEKHQHLLLFLTEFEGLEESPAVLHLAPIPNQFILPIVGWFYAEQHRRRFFLVGSDPLYFGAVTAMVQDQLKTREGASLVGKQFVSAHGLNMRNVVEQIRANKPDVILNLIRGDANTLLVRALQAANISSRDIPTVSFSFTEQELRSLHPEDMAGHYLGGSYFEGIETPENRRYLQQLRQRYGAQRVVSEPMMWGYVAVQLWAQAVAAARTEEVRSVRRLIRQQTLDGPSGPLRLDPASGYAFNAAHVATFQPDGRSNIVWSTDAALAPEPFPPPRPRAEWQTLVEDLTT
jgi:urea transport system substrate-binding protein